MHGPLAVTERHWRFFRRCGSNRRVVDAPKTLDSAHQIRAKEKPRAGGGASLGGVSVAVINQGPVREPGDADGRIYPRGEIPDPAREGRRLAGEPARCANRMLYG